MRRREGEREGGREEEKKSEGEEEMERGVECCLSLSVNKQNTVISSP